MKKDVNVGEILFVIVLLLIGYAVGVSSPTVVKAKYVNEARDSLYHALEIIESTDECRTEREFNDFHDALLDDVNEAIACLEEG